MKQIFIILICTLVCTAKLYSQTDSLYKAHHKQILKIEQSLRSLKLENDALKQSVKIQRKMIDSQRITLDSLESNVVSNIKNTANQLGVRIDEANASLQAKASANDLKSRTMWGISLFLFFVIISFVVYWLLHRRITKGYLDVTALKLKADKLNEDILNQFSLDMTEMQKIAASLVALSSMQVSQTSNVAPDHSLIKTLADRIIFMEMTLYKMDSTVKGHKTLVKAIANMKNNLFANGYELVDMLGKPYHEGMLVSNTDFVDDEMLKEGERIITKIREVNKDVIIMVDNCYGELVEKKEPGHIGADIVVGSLMKNLGGGIAPTGGYIAGRKDLIFMCAERLTAPGIGKDLGANFNMNNTFFKGVFMAPNAVKNALKSAVFSAYMLEKLGFNNVSPRYNEERTDIIQTLELGTEENLVKFTQAIQNSSPIDSFVATMPAPMPGYPHDEVMAAGTFTSGSTIELSADAPVVAPYTLYIQGGLTLEYSKLSILFALTNVLKK